MVVEDVGGVAQLRGVCGRRAAGRFLLVGLRAAGVAWAEVPKESGRSRRQVLQCAQRQGLRGRTARGKDVSGLARESSKFVLHIHTQGDDTGVAK